MLDKLFGDFVHCGGYVIWAMAIALGRVIE